MDLVEEFANTVELPDLRMLDDIQEYVEWKVGRSLADFKPTLDDDVDLRTYLLQLRLNKVKERELEATAKSLERFYEWAATKGVIEENPFEEYDFERPFLSPDEVKRRRDELKDDPQQREISHLRALNELAQHLNQSADLEAALAATLHIITKAMNLKTAWIFLLPEIWGQTHIITNPPHDYALTAACGLPPGLERDGRYFLCQPPDCHCQGQLRRGRLKRAVNIVQCSRLQDSARADGDNRGLFFHATTPIISGDRILGLLNVATEEWQIFTSSELQFLSAAGAQVAVALERAKLYELARDQQQRLAEELKMAFEIQASLLPDFLPVIPGFETAAYWCSAREMSGDFYDVIPLNNGRFGLVVGDVSDKGAPAAMYMAMTSSLLRSHANHIDSPAITLKAVNQHILSHAASDMFVTIFYAILDPGKGTITYASAGHDPALLQRASGEIEHLMPTGPLVGIFKELALQDVELTLAPGDTLLIFTDGVTDAVNTQMEMYDRSRLQSALTHAPQTAQPLLEYILNDLNSFTTAAAQLDDITLFALTTIGPAGTLPPLPQSQ
jgi:sigma-B regulation protein RsbU (phosphoserine phosphatase)